MDEVNRLRRCIYNASKARKRVDGAEIKTDFFICNHEFFEKLLSYKEICQECLTYPVETDRYTISNKPVYFGNVPDGLFPCSRSDAYS